MIHVMYNAQDAEGYTGHKNYGEELDETTQSKQGKYYTIIV